MINKLKETEHMLHKGQCILYMFFDMDKLKVDTISDIGLNSIKVGLDMKCNLLLFISKWHTLMRMAHKD